MTTRLFYKAIMQRTINVQKQIMLVQRHSMRRGFRHITFPENRMLGQTARTQLLHVKVYDKDPRLEAQREANRHTDREELISGTQLHRRVETETENASQLKKPFINKKNQADEDEDHFYKNDANKFGSATVSEGDADDAVEEEFISNSSKRGSKLRNIDYVRLIKGHLNDNRLKDAIGLFEQRMLKEDRAQPDHYIYNLLISACGKAGYTQKAFNLFTKMRQRGLNPTGGTYTSLFNACANAPTPADGLSRANRLREVMLEKGVKPNVKNYNAMIKAYGRWGDVKTAYLLVDEMIDEKLDVTTETFNFLLQACASDKSYGFRHCLVTWHKMLQRGIRPDYYSFHTVLRCVRDCEFGDLQTMHQALQQILNESEIMHLSHNARQHQSSLLPESDRLQADPKPNLADAEVNAIASTTQGATQALQLANDSTQLEMPNLLTLRPHLGSMVSLTEVTRPHDRFLLLGGLTGFLDLMKQNSVTPNIEAFTTMLEVIPPTNTGEKQLLSFIRKIGLKVDIDFFNILIKKRAMRFDYEGGKEVLSLIRTAGLHPDIVTYGVLSLGCRTVDEARELLQQMKQNGIRINIQILGAMLATGCIQKSFPYVTEIMQISLDEHIKPSAIFLRHLHKFYNNCARAIDARHPSTKTHTFKKAHARFCEKLRLYYEEQAIADMKLEDAIKKIKEHPYAQYKEANVEGVEPSKNELLWKKRKIRKYIKKIKIENLRGDAPEPDGHIQNTQKSIE